MVIKNEIYIVYGQDNEGRSVSPHYFLDRCHACKYAVASKGKIAYGLPEVRKITAIYNTENIGVNTYGNGVEILSADKVERYAKGDE